MPRDVVLFVHRWNEHLSARGWLSAVEQLNGVIREVAEETHTRLVETAVDITGREDLFRDLVHFSPEGHAEMAGTIASALVRALPASAEQ